MTPVRELPLAHLATTLAPLRGPRTDPVSALAPLPLRVAATGDGTYEVLDRLRALGHSPSWRWGCYDSVNATSGDLPASYLSGDAAEGAAWSPAKLSSRSRRGFERSGTNHGQMRTFCC